jgi:hypothetical protein
MTDEQRLREQRDEIERLRAALGEIAQQRLTDEMPEDESADAPFDEAYDMMINRARKALK